MLGAALLAVAQWIWYPGDFETHLLQEVSAQRLEWGGYTPVAWPLYHPYAVMGFRKTVNLAEDETIDVWFEGEGNFDIGGTAFGSITNRHMRFTVPKGERTLVFKMFDSKRLPSVYVRGKTIASDATWECEHSNRQVWERVDCAEELSDPALAPGDFHLPVKPAEAVSSRSNGKGGLLVDFGRETFGFPVFHDVKGTGRIKVIYGESEPEALADGLEDARIGQKETAADVWECLDLTSCTRFAHPKSRGFRYVNVVPVSGDVSVGSLSMLVEYNPVDRRGSFRCNDERVNRIWEVAAQTLELTTREFYIDGLKRDRFVWSGDARQSCQMGYYLYGDSSVARRTLWALRGKEPVWMHINRIVDYTFYWFDMVREYVLYTGDEDFLKKVYPRMVSLMDFVEGRLREDGLYEARPGDWVFVDWAPQPLRNQEGPVAVEQMLLARAYLALAEAAQRMGDEARANDSADKGRRLRDSVKRLFWDAGKGVFVHALDRDLKPLDQVTRYPNIFGILDGSFSRDEQASVLANCLDSEAVMPIVTPYMRYYELEAKCRLGRAAEVLHEIRSYWGGMLDEGATSFWELYDPRESGVQHYAMYGRPFGRSLCHAWGASPVYLFGRYFLGVEPTLPGYATYTVTPNSGGLTWMEGSVPTPHGDIRVRVEKEEVVVQGAPGTKGIVRAFGREFVVEGDRRSLFSRCNSRTGVQK